MSSCVHITGDDLTDPLDRVRRARDEAGASSLVLRCAIDEAVLAGLSQRTVAEAAGLSHTGVAKVVDRLRDAGPSLERVDGRWRRNQAPAGHRVPAASGLPVGETQVRVGEPEFGSLYEVSRTDGRDLSGGDREHARYFVLDYVNDPHARDVLARYAQLTAMDSPKLAAQIERLLTRSWCATCGREFAPHRTDASDISWCSRRCELARGRTVPVSEPEGLYRNCEEFYAVVLPGHPTDAAAAAAARQWLESGVCGLSVTDLLGDEPFDFDDADAYPAQVRRVYGRWVELTAGEELAWEEQPAPGPQLTPVTVVHVI